MYVVHHLHSRQLSLQYSKYPNICQGICVAGFNVKTQRNNQKTMGRYQQAISTLRSRPSVHLFTATILKKGLHTTIDHLLLMETISIPKPHMSV